MYACFPFLFPLVLSALKLDSEAEFSTLREKTYTNKREGRTSLSFFQDLNKSSNDTIRNRYRIPGF